MASGYPATLAEEEKKIKQQQKATVSQMKKTKDLLRNCVRFQWAKSFVGSLVRFHATTKTGNWMQLTTLLS